MKAGHEDEHVDGTSAVPWPQLNGVRPRTSPILDDDRRSEDGKGRGGAKSNNGAQPVGRSPAGGREEGLDRTRKDEACDEVLSNEGPDLSCFGQTKDRVETALKVLSTMSPEEVQERLNAEDLSRPIVPVKPKTKKKEPTKKKLELVSPPHTYRRTVEERDDGRRSNPLPQKKMIRKMNFQCHRKEASQQNLVRRRRPDCRRLLN